MHHLGTHPAWAEAFSARVQIAFVHGYRFPLGTLLNITALAASTVD